MGLWNSLFTPLFSKDQLTSYALLLILSIGIFFFLKKLFSTKKLKVQDREYLFILIAPFFVYGIYVFYPLPLWEHYLLPISILIVFLLAMTIQRIFVKGTGYKILVAVFLLFAIVPAITWTKASYINAAPYVPSGDGSYRNQLEVAQWVLADTKNKEYGYFVYSTGILTYNMDYLLSWISEKDNLITPSSLKHPTTYLIMYPYSATDKDAYSYWKKNVIRTTGKVVSTKTFDSGITVEKLAIPAGDPEPDPNYYQNLIFR